VRIHHWIWIFQCLRSHEDTGDLIPCAQSNPQIESQTARHRSVVDSKMVGTAMSLQRLGWNLGFGNSARFLGQGRPGFRFWCGVVVSNVRPTERSPNREKGRLCDCSWQRWVDVSLILTFHRRHWVRSADLHISAGGDRFRLIAAPRHLSVFSVYFREPRTLSVNILFRLRT
jgi:hypothetical protein